jgi:hypothetical protein
MKNGRIQLRNSGLGDPEATNRHMVSQLRGEILALDKRIARLQQDNQPDLDMVQHLGGLMHSRQSVLNWMQLRNTRR